MHLGKQLYTETSKYAILEEKGVFTVIQITRQTIFVASFGQLTLLCNGNPIASLTNKQSQTLRLPSSQVTLSIKGDKKSAIEVTDGDHLTVQTSTAFMISWLIAVVLLLSNILIDPPAMTRAICSFIAAACILSSTLIFPTFSIKKTNP